jgi:hypothetical protein
VTCIERGFLEEQSLLLYESIRRFGGRHNDAPIYAYAPRAGHGVQLATIAAMEALNVVYIDQPLNRDVNYFPYANKNFAAAHAERTTKHDTLVFLDSDSVLFQEPELFELPEGIDVRVRPVDRKGMSSSGAADPIEPYWRDLATVCHVDLESLPYVRTTVGEERIRATFNGGLVVVRNGIGIFTRWEENMLAVHRARLQPRPDSFWGTGQTTLVMAIYGRTSRVEMLPDSYNYPLHKHDNMPPERRISSSRDLIHVHYHWMFERQNWPSCALARPEFDWQPDRREWLFERVPLTVERPPTDLGMVVAAQ